MTEYETESIQVKVRLMHQALMRFSGKANLKGLQRSSFVCTQPGGRGGGREGGKVD